MSPDRSKAELADLRSRLALSAFQAPPSGGGRFGLEVELIPVRWRAGSSQPEPIPVHGADGSLTHVERFAQSLDISVKTPEGESRVTESMERGHFTFEPGGQVEFSGAPYTSPAAAYDHAAEIVDGLIAYAATTGVSYHTIGFNPWHTLDELPLVTEAARYQTMDAVYASIGPYGRRMMRQSATVHVNLDLGDAERAPRRWRAAQLLAPLAVATFAYSPYADGRPSGFASFRGRVWTDVDPTRCGFPPRFLADPLADPVDQYLDFALGARLLMIKTGDTVQAQTTPLPFSRWLADGFAGTYPTRADWENHLTTLFPEVRPRGFFELRSADCQARPFWSVPLTWWTSLLCDDSALGQVLERLDPTAHDLPTRYLDGARHGAKSELVGDDIAWAFALAADALPRFRADFISNEMQRAFHTFAEEFTLRRRSPAHALLELAGDSVAPSALREIEETWSSRAGTRLAATSGAPGDAGHQDRS